MDNVNAKVTTPLPLQGKEICEIEEACDETLYRGAIGSLMFLSTTTRPDISFSLCKLSQKCSNPSMTDWNNVLHLLCYIKRTGKKGLCYRKSGKQVEMYVDSDWASEPSDRKSVSGLVVLLGGGSVIWHSRKQQRVTTSTQHAEFMALKDICKESMWLRNLLWELGCDTFMKVPLIRVPFFNVREMILLPKISTLQLISIL